MVGKTMFCDHLKYKASLTQNDAACRYKRTQKSTKAMRFNRIYTASNIEKVTFFKKV